MSVETPAEGVQDNRCFACDGEGGGWVRFGGDQSDYEWQDCVNCHGTGVIPWGFSYKAWPTIAGNGDEFPEDTAEASTICIWCGKQCVTADALETHEEECAPE